MDPAQEINVVLLASRLAARGSSLYTVRLARHLPEAGVQTRLVCRSADCVPPDRRAQMSIAEYPHLELPIWRHMVIRELVHQLREQPPALVHVQTPASLALGEVVSAALGVPMVLTVHDYLPPRGTLRFRLAKVIAVSEAVKGDLVERVRVDENLIEVIHSGVEAPPEPAEKPHTRGKPVPVVGTAGPLETLKGQEYFLRAAKQVLDRGLDVEFLVAGSGPDESHLRRLAQELEIAAHVTFVPYMKQYSDALAAMDVFCLPSLQQGLGTVMLEAMARGKPVIATDVGGISTIVRDGQTGLVVPSRDDTTLSEKIVELLTDNALARRLADAGRMLVRESFSIEQMVNHTAELYRKVLEQPPAPLKIHIED